LVRTVAVLDYVGGHFELEQSDMIFTSFSGPVLWIGKEKNMIESLLRRASSLVPVAWTASWLLHPQANFAMKKHWRYLAAREVKVAQFNPCDEPLAFLHRSDYVGSKAMKPAPHHHLLN
jgi:hypothetical protein